MKKTKPQILLTNDDGIDSPGLWAAASALAEVGYVTIVAPREQCSAAGRALYLWADGKIEKRSLDINGQSWQVYAVGGSPAQTVIHALLEVMPARPDLVVSGINYGENLGNVVTASGTVGAAMEAVSMGVPSIAVSLQVKEDLWLSYDKNVDFTTAAGFTARFARWMLSHRLPPDAHLLNINVPYSATPETEWRMARLASHRYWTPYIQRQDGWDSEARIDGKVSLKPGDVAPDTDIHTLMFDHMVSVTPLSLDLTSRIYPAELEKQIRQG
jgi:5'-nucleotidase